MCRIDDGEPTTILSRVKGRKARKVRRCDECYRDIMPGELYDYTSMVSDGSFSDHSLCDHCQIAAEWLMENCQGYLFSEVRDEIREHAEEYPAIAVPLLRMAAGMKRKWKSFTGNGLLPIPKQAPFLQPHHL